MIPDRTEIQLMTAKRILSSDQVLFVKCLKFQYN